MAGGALPAIEEALDLGAVALCAEAVGVMRRLVEDTVAYSRERRQFGVAIASFQVLRHRMADMLMHLEQARAITGLTVTRLAQPGANRSRLVSSAMVTTARACRFISQAAVQIHGGMGMTDELAVGHYFKRATVIEGLFGSVDHHLRRYADA
jgi:alkylation response protein AidB-like acyl-CoA dehydrogenase